jgi:hypothetical protein
MSDQEEPFAMTDEERLAWFEAQAEKAYDEMYDAHSPGDATARYSDTKEFFRSAIMVAEQLGKPDVAERLGRRLAHVKAVFRSQFT